MLFIFFIFYSYVIFPEISKHLKNNLLALSCRMNHWSLFLWITKQGSMHCHGVQVELLVVYITTGFLSRIKHQLKLLFLFFVCCFSTDLAYSQYFMKGILCAIWFTYYVYLSFKIHSKIKIIIKKIMKNNYSWFWSKYSTLNCLKFWHIRRKEK